MTLSNSANIVADGETKDRFRVCSNKKKIEIRDMKFDAIMYVQNNLSRVGYACEMNFDPVDKHYIFSGCSLTTCSK